MIASKQYVSQSKSYLRKLSNHFSEGYFQSINLMGSYENTYLSIQVTWIMIFHTDFFSYENNYLCIPTVQFGENYLALVQFICDTNKSKFTYFCVTNKLSLCSEKIPLVLQYNHRFLLYNVQSSFQMQTMLFIHPVLLTYN